MTLRYEALAIVGPSEPAIRATFDTVEEAWEFLAEDYVDREDAHDDGDLVRDVFDPERSTVGTETRRNPADLDGLPLVYSVRSI